MPLSRIDTWTACIFFLGLLLSACGNSDHNQGLLQICESNPHYFSYGDKTIVLVGSGEHYGAVVNADFDFEKYLQTLHADGLNITRLFTGAYIEKQGDFNISGNTLAPAPGHALLPWKRSDEAGYALGGNKFDLDQWDENYFRRLREFIGQAEQLEVFVEVNLFSSHYSGGWNYSPLNPRNNVNGTDSIASVMVNTLENGNLLAFQERYVRKIVRELNEFGNIYYEVQNEPWADQTDTVIVRDPNGPTGDWRNTVQVATEKSKAWQQRVVDWITAEEQGLARHHLISMNIANFHFPVKEADPRVKILNFHYAIPGAVSENYNLERIIGLNETGFAGRRDSTYRRQAWRFMMAGGGLFNHLDYSFFVGSEDGRDTTYSAPGGGSPALRSQLSILGSYFDRLDLASMQADQSVVAPATGLRAWAIGNAQWQWAIYLIRGPGSGSRLPLDLPVGEYRAEWTNVLTGQVFSIGEVTPAGLILPNGPEELVILINRK